MTTINQRWQAMVPQIVGRDPGDYARTLQEYLESLDSVLTATNVILSQLLEQQAVEETVIAPESPHLRVGVFLLMGA